ncbi:MAG: hypothetical protein LBH40_03070 [Alphaproteobacteria bacterium]|jgi:uncharacterized cupredoxin-like copper-binding protein|nr:hypothetical protein [Alphaproteobacteria bacterium]
MTNRFSVIGNIYKQGIKIDEEKGVAKFSVAVSPGKDKEAQWYNLTYFLKKDDEGKFIAEDKVLEDLKSIKNLEDSAKQPQLKLNGYLSYNESENDYGEKTTYTNLIVNDMKINKDFEIPKAMVKLEGVIHKELATKTQASIDNNTGKETSKEFSYLTIKTADKDGNYEKFHFVGTTNKEQSQVLEKSNLNDQISIEARLSPKGKIKITKECPISITKENGEKITNKSNSKAHSKDTGVEK